MAIVAEQFSVCGIQGETGIGVVKPPTAPGIGVVAHLAAAVEGSLVHVFFFMAAGASAVRSREFLVFVAAFAQRQAVHAEEWKSSQVVMKPVGLRPTVFFVAVLAWRVDIVAVHILLLVTIDTTGGLLPALAGGMTRLARYFTVPSAQYKISVLVVIKIHLVPGRLVMAGRTFLTHGACVGVLKTVAACAVRLQFRGDPRLVT